MEILQQVIAAIVGAAAVIGVAWAVLEYIFKSLRK